MRKHRVLILFVMFWFACQPVYAGTSENVPSYTPPDLSMQKIRTVIGESTPDFIAKPIMTAIAKLEEWRVEGGEFSEEKKVTLKAQILELKDDTFIEKLFKLWKYTELLFFTVLAFIFHNRTMFYIVLLAFLFWVLRFIWRLFFF